MVRWRKVKFINNILIEYWIIITPVDKTTDDNVKKKIIFKHNPEYQGPFLKRKLPETPMLHSFGFQVILSLGGASLALAMRSIACLASLKLKRNIHFKTYQKADGFGNTDTKIISSKMCLLFYVIRMQRSCSRDCSFRDGADGYMKTLSLPVIKET